MASFRDDGLELNVKPGFGGVSLPTGERFTIFALTSDSSGVRSYAPSSNNQLWMIDTSGQLHELTNDWLETKVAETSAKLDFIYPAVTAFMSAGLLFLVKQQQGISGNIDMVGSLAITGNISVNDGGILITNGSVMMNSDTSATRLDVFEQLNFVKAGTPHTLEDVVPFFIRSSANRLQPEGWFDPRLCVIGDQKIYNEFKQTDRGLRFTVIDRETFFTVHDEVYDTAGSQFRVTDLAFDLFVLMNDTKHIGILNSREEWESLIWRKQTVESTGISASDVSGAYSNLVIGSLINQFDRFGLLKGIRAAQTYSEISPSGAGSQYCAMFEGSNIYVDTSGASALAIIYPTNRALESWIPRNTQRLPVGSETQRAQLVGWFVRPRQLDITDNISDRSTAIVTTPYGRENDATREINFVNISGAAGPYNVRIDNLTADVLTLSFQSSAGYMSLTDHIIRDVGYGDIDRSGDAVNVDFSRIVTPIGAVLDYAGDTPPTNFLMCEGTTLAVSSSENTLLFNAIGTRYGAVYNISGSPTHFLIPNCRGRVTIDDGTTTVAVPTTPAGTSFTFTLAMSGGGSISPQESLPPFIVFNKIIRWK